MTGIFIISLHAFIHSTINKTKTKLSGKHFEWMDDDDDDDDDDLDDNDDDDDDDFFMSLNSKPTCEHLS